MALKPKDLTFGKLQVLIDQNKTPANIMILYNFESERYFRGVLKTLGYRLLRGKLWVIKDKLWLNKKIADGFGEGKRKHLTDQEKRTCADLYKQGKTYTEIVAETGIPYHFVYKWADVDTYRKNQIMYQKKRYEGSRHKSKQVVNAVDRPLPPINPPGQVIKIHADIDQLERHLQNLLGDKLSPIIGPLSMRKPPMNFTSQDKLS